MLDSIPRLHSHARLHFSSQISCAVRRVVTRHRGFLCILGAELSSYGCKSPDDWSPEISLVDLENYGSSRSFFESVTGGIT